jgi:hypothetical protein
MAQDAQDDDGGYGRWRWCWAVAQDDTVAAVQQQHKMATRHGGAGECRVVIDGGGATRMARWLQDVR